MNCAGCGSLTSHSMKSARTVRSAPQPSPCAGSLATLSGSSLGPNHGTSRSGAECSSFRSAALSDAPNFCCVIASSAAAGSAGAATEAVALCDLAANDGNAARVSNPIAKAATMIAFRFINIAVNKARLDQAAPSALERGLGAAVDMAGQRSARLGLAARVDQRNEMRLGKYAALLVATANAWHFIQDWLQERGSVIVITGRKCGAAASQRQADLAPYMRQAAGLFFGVPLHVRERARCLFTLAGASKRIYVDAVQEREQGVVGIGADMWCDRAPFVVDFCTGQLQIPEQQYSVGLLDHHIG